MWEEGQNQEMVGLQVVRPFQSTDLSQLQDVEIFANCISEILSALCCFSNRMKLRAPLNYPAFAKESVAIKQSKTKKSRKFMQFL